MYTSLSDRKLGFHNVGIEVDSFLWLGSQNLLNRAESNKMLDCFEQSRIKLKCEQNQALETIIEITIKIQLQHGIFKGVTKTVFLSYKTEGLSCWKTWKLFKFCPLYLWVKLFSYPLLYTGYMYRAERYIETKFSAFILRKTIKAIYWDTEFKSIVQSKAS